MSTSILKKTYLEKAVPNLKESLGFKSNMAVPNITKVTINKKSRISFFSNLK